MSSNYTFEFLAWCDEKGSDKVWGYIRLRDDNEYLYNFWGRRGKKLTWKRYPFDRQHVFDGKHLCWRALPLTISQELESKGRQKLSKGYQQVDLNDIETATPGFTDEFENQFVLAKLFETYHGEGA
jgi:hypothetical protein